MPQELPGFYYDAEKNRYFPIKGPIPGTSRSSSTAAQKPISKQPTRATNSSLTGATTSKLLQARELRGNVFSLSKGKCNFKEEFQKRLISQPVVWRYEATNQTGDITLEQIELNVQTPEGQFRTDVLLTGSVNGFFSLFEVGNVGQHAHDTVKFIPGCVWPRIKDNKTESSKAPEHIWRLNKASILMPSSVSCIKLFGKHPSCATGGGSVRHALLCTPVITAIIDNSGDKRCFPVIENRITSLGSETTGGSIYALNLDNPLDIGTNLGAAMVNMETGMASWVCRSKSDILAQQVIHSGNVVLCGFRNGAIVTVDVRERQRGCSSRAGRRHRIPYSRLQRNDRVTNEQWFELKANIWPSHTTFMPSSISCLQSLQLYDQYFLASSMDGTCQICRPISTVLLTLVVVHSWNSPNIPSPHTIMQPGSSPTLRPPQSLMTMRYNPSPEALIKLPFEVPHPVAIRHLPPYSPTPADTISQNHNLVKLYDHRLTTRGAVQSYEGHVNSHTRIQLGVDQSERFVMSGGEDCKLRIWSIRSGELVFEDKFSNSVPSAVCWRTQRSMGPQIEGKIHEEFDLGQRHSWEAWIGTQEGLFRMNWS
ncbi:hypothetical protein WN943_011921 [Citrus x changshan-huyou]